MRQNYKGDKRQKEAARKKKQEDKRNKKQGKNTEESLLDGLPTEASEESANIELSENDAKL